MTPASRLTWRFALLPAVVVAALTLVLLGGGQRLLSNEAKQRTLARNQQRADLLASQLQASLQDAVNQVRLLARSTRLQPNAAVPRMREELDRLVAHSPRFVWVGLVATDGRVLAGSRGWLEGQSIAQRPVFSHAHDGTVGDVHQAVALAPVLQQLPAGAGELIDIGEPVLNEAGEVVAIVAAHLGVEWVREQLALAVGPDDEADADDLHAMVLTAAGTRSVLPGIAVPTGLPATLGPPQAWSDADGQRWLLAQAALDVHAGGPSLLPWRAVVLQSEAAALRPMRGVAKSMLWFGIVAALLLGGAGFWLSRRLLMRWDPLFDAALSGKERDRGRMVAQVQALIAERGESTPTEMLMGWLARDAGNLRRALDHVPVAVALTDREYRGEYVNPCFTQLLGWTSEAVQGRPVIETLLEAAEHLPWSRLIEQLHAEPGEFVTRMHALTPSGEHVAVQCHLVPMFNGEGRQVGGLLIAHDIRAERDARLRADALDDRLRALADAALDTLLATLDVDGRVLEWSRGAEVLSDHPPAQALGSTLDTLLPGAGDVESWLRRARIDGLCPLVLQGGGRRFEGSLYRLGMAPGAARFGLILRDATASAAASAAAEESNPANGSTREELALFNRRLLDRERLNGRRLAHTLHDELGQTLAALRLHWEAYRGGGTQTESMHTRIADLVVLANRQVRGVLAELRPPLLDELGLAAALDNEIRQHHGTGEGETRVELQAGDEAQLQRWSADIEYGAFMIAREAVLNALRHAHASVIRLSLEGDAQWLELLITDDGHGFSPKAEQLGLIGMRERAGAIDAELHIDARPGRGTMVALTWIPSDDDSADDEPHLPG